MKRIKIKNTISNSGVFNAEKRLVLQWGMSFNNYVCLKCI